MPVTPATSIGTQRPPNSDRSAYAWVLSPGTALLVDQDTKAATEVKITKEVAQKIPHTFELHEVDGVLMAYFQFGDLIYAQPLPKSREAGRVIPTKRTVVKIAKEAPKPAKKIVRRARKLLDLL